MILIVFLLMSLVGGANAVLVKFVVSEFPPIILVAIRSILAAIIIIPLIYYQKSVSKISMNARLVLAGLLFAGNWLFFATGIQYTSVVMSSIIYLPTSLIVAILGFLFLRERLSKYQISGLILTMLGMTILIYGSVKSADTLSFGKPIGNLLVGAGLLSWSFYLVVTRGISNLYTPATITFFNFIATATISLLLIPLETTRRNFHFSNVTGGGILGLLALALFSSVIFFYLYQWLIKHTSAFISSLVLYATAITGSLAGVIFYGEKLTGSLITAAFLVFLGVFLATSYGYISQVARK